MKDHLSFKTTVSGTSRVVSREGGSLMYHTHLTLYPSSETVSQPHHVFAVSFLQYMKKLVEKSDSKLNKPARNLLSVAYKNLVGSKRSSWRVVSSHIINLRSSEEDKSQDESKAIAARRELSEKFLEKIVGELKEVCNEVVVGYVCVHVCLSQERIFFSVEVQVQFQSCQPRLACPY